MKAMCKWWIQNQDTVAIACNEIKPNRHSQAATQGTPTSNQLKPSATWTLACPVLDPFFDSERDVCVPFIRALDKILETFA